MFVTVSHSKQIFFNKWLYICFGRRCYTKASGLRAPFRRSQHPEVLNRKAYWWSKHPQISRTLLQLMLAHSKSKKFAELFRYMEIVENSTFGARLYHELSLQGPYTMFLPSDEGMNSICPQHLSLLRENPNVLENFILMHVVKGQWLLRDLCSRDLSWDGKKLRGGRKLETHSTGKVEVKVTGDLSNCSRVIWLNKSQLIHPEFLCRNGVAHLIDIPFDYDATNSALQGEIPP